MKAWLKGGIIIAIIYAILFLLHTLIGRGSADNMISALVIGLIFGFIAGSFIGLIINIGQKDWLKGGLMGIIIVLMILGIFFLENIVFGILHGTFLSGEGVMYLPVVLLVFVGVLLGGFLIGALTGWIIGRIRSKG